MKVTNVYVKRLEGLPRLLGTADVVLDQCLKVRDLLILPRADGQLYISMPAKKVVRKGWVAIVHPTNQELTEEIQKAVALEYKRLVQEGIPHSGYVNGNGEEADHLETGSMGGGSHGS